MKRRIQFERSTGNVFADIGIANPEQALAKAEIARQVNRAIQDRRLSQSEAASILGIDQPRVSALSKGRLSVFSLEKMMDFASRMGNEVEISIKRSEHSGIKVASAGTACGQYLVSTMVVGGQSVEFSFSMDPQIYGERKTHIRLDRSEMFRLEDESATGCALVAA